MAKTLSKSGILTGQTIEASEISQSIDALTGIEAYNLTFSGSLNLTGSIVTGSISNAITASYAITASHALNVNSGGGGVGDLQQVMTSGSSTTIAITGSAISASGDVITQKVGIIDGAGIGFGANFTSGNEDSDVEIFTDSVGEINFSKNNIAVLSILSSNEILINPIYSFKEPLNVTNNITASGVISASSDIYGRDGRFSRGTVEVEIIGSTSEGIIGTQTNHDLSLRRSNIEKLRITETRTISPQSLLVTGSITVSGSGAQTPHLNIMGAISASGGIEGATINIKGGTALSTDTNGYLTISSSKVIIPNLPTSNPNVVDQLYTTDLEGVRVIAVSDG